MFELLSSGDGICLECGHEGRSANGWVEPDARDYPCPECETKSMMGYEQALIEGLWEPDEF